MRVLLATFWPYPHSGGLSTYVDVLRAGLTAAGCEVDILGDRPDLTSIYLTQPEGETSVPKADAERSVRSVVHDRDDALRSAPKLVRSLEYRRYVFEGVHLKIVITRQSSGIGAPIEPKDPVARIPATARNDATHGALRWLARPLRSTASRYHFRVV